MEDQETNFAPLKDLILQIAGSIQYFSKCLMLADSSNSANNCELIQLDKSNKVDFLLLFSFISLFQA